METKNIQKRNKAKEDDLKGFKEWLQEDKNLSHKVIIDTVSRVKNIEKNEIGLDKNKFTKDPKYIYKILEDLNESKNKSKKSIKVAVSYYFKYVLITKSQTKKIENFNDEQLKKWLTYNTYLKELKECLKLNGNILGSFAESIVANSLGLMKFKDSQEGVDLIDFKNFKKLKTYQIKSRLAPDKNKYIQDLNKCTDLDFDFLITLLFLATGELFFAVKHSKKELNDTKDKYKKKSGGYVFQTTKYFLKKGTCITGEIIKHYKLLECKNTVYNWNDLP